MIGQLICPRHVGEALSLPKLTQLGGSLNVERLRRSGRLRAAPTRCGGNRGLSGRQVGDPSGEAALAPLKGELAARTG